MMLVSPSYSYHNQNILFVYLQDYNFDALAYKHSETKFVLIEING